MTTVVLAVPVHPLASVTVTRYVPAALSVAILIVGFCAVLVNPLGPDHRYSDQVPAISISGDPAHTGLLEVKVTIKGGHGSKQPETPEKVMVSQSAKVPLSTICME